MTLRQADTDQGQELEPSEIHNVLRNDRRRRAIKHLRDSDDTLDVDALAEHIASVETGESPPPRDVRKSVYVSLHQTHLPKLDDLGIIDYDQRSKELHLKDRAQEVEVYMEVVPEHDITWANYYLGLAALEFITLLGVKFDLFPLSALDVEYWAWYYVLLFGLSAAYHLYSERRNQISVFG
jgi:hypothetical protein